MRLFPKTVRHNMRAADDKLITTLLCVMAIKLLIETPCVRLLMAMKIR